MISKPATKSAAKTRPNRANKPAGKAKPVTRKGSAAGPRRQEPCPRGGAHEWTTEAGETACAKCHEPAPQRNKPTRAPGKRATAKSGKIKATKPAKAVGKHRTSALDAAVRVLTEAKQPLTTRAMIDVMAAKGYWTSPGGKTPHATLYSAIVREITTKKTAARFQKIERGKFAVRKA